MQCTSLFKDRRILVRVKPRIYDPASLRKSMLTYLPLNHLLMCVVKLIGIRCWLPPDFFFCTKVESFGFGDREFTVLMNHIFEGSQRVFVLPRPRTHCSFSEIRSEIYIIFERRVIKEMNGSSLFFGESLSSLESATNRGSWRGRIVYL